MSAWPRTVCPVCRRSVAVNPDKRKIVDHKYPRPRDRALDLVLCHGSERQVEMNGVLFLPFEEDAREADGEQALF
ncbi:hypothetical protein [Streptomyces zingiberis]|uniref:HNH endonuclease n=1 Tax=Streptomyces zingiberis TaxID=2053010 RepID=A0ABX1BY19_9ACTN|nr:hypothetical protein [Streptomyces zingiberis]NJQ01188.1 hypothetical protein [Streptomyces zingiberis]